MHAALKAPELEKLKGAPQMQTKNFTIENIDLIEELESKIAPSGLAALDQLRVVSTKTN